MNRKDLQELTLVGPPGYNQELDLLVLKKKKTRPPSCTTPRQPTIHRFLYFHSASIGCPVGYDDIAGKCYVYYGDIDPQNRDVADNLCVSANSHLWIINDEAEFDLVTKFYGIQKVCNEVSNQLHQIFKKQRAEKAWANQGPVSRFADKTNLSLQI